MRKLTILATVVLATAAVQALHTASAQSDGCSGLTGAAYGLCIAAYAVGCDNVSGDPNACGRIESSFEQLTGTTPPWLLPPCPCGSTNDFIDAINMTGATAVVCAFDEGPRGESFVAISDASTEDVLAITYLPPLMLRLDSCRLVGDVAHTVDEQEALGCANTIQATAQHFGAICTGP